MEATFVRRAVMVGLVQIIAISFVLADGARPGGARAKMDPPKTKVAPPNRLPQGTNCYKSLGQWTCSAPDGWTCSSNPNGTINSEDCACVSGCKKPQPSPSPTPPPRPR
jgi:hypothetical protein